MSSLFCCWILRGRASQQLGYDFVAAGDAQLFRHHPQAAVGDDEVDGPDALVAFERVQQMLGKDRSAGAGDGDGQNAGSCVSLREHLRFVSSTLDRASSSLSLCMLRRVATRNLKLETAPHEFRRHQETVRPGEARQALVRRGGAAVAASAVRRSRLRQCRPSPDAARRHAGGHLRSGKDSATSGRNLCAAGEARPQRAGDAESRRSRCAR